MEVYERLSNHGRRPDGLQNTDEAKNIYPRYLILDAIAVEVDRLDPDQLPPHEQVLQRLQAAGVEAEIAFSKGHEPESVEAIAQEDERRNFAGFVDSLAGMEPGVVAPLPYRRTLAAAEAGEWRTVVQTAWDLDGLDFWLPLDADQVGGRPVLALRAEAFFSGYEPTGPASLAVRRALGDLGITRLWELREYGPEFEREAESAAFVYTGAEGMFFSGELDWLIFASHSGVTTLGGSVVEQLRRSWPGLERFLWRG